MTLGEFLYGAGKDDAAIRNIHGLLARGEAFHIETLNYNKSKDPYRAEIDGNPVKDVKGKLLQFFISVTDINEQKRYHPPVAEESQQQQQIVAASVITAQEREREMVSRQLQTEVNQMLTTVKLYTELCLTGAGKKEEILRKSLNLLQSTIEEIDNLSKRLYPPSLNEVSLKDSLQELIEKVTTTNKIAISLEMRRVNHLGISKELHLALYRILHEQLVNISTHAQAKNVRIVVNGTNNELNLKVKDDGIGFDTSKKSKGVGITNMISRAETLKGVLSINSAPGSGCELHVRFPLN